jgi:outer membrane protein assembly factor BamB
VIGVVIALAFQATVPTVTVKAAPLPSDAAVAFQIDATHSGSQPSDPISPVGLQRQWSIDLGAPVNYSVIAGGHLFVTAGALLYAFDVQTGTQIWGPIDTGGRYAYATYDGGKLFVHNATNFLRALDPATGKTLWLDRLPGEISSDTPPVALNGRVYAVGIASGGILYAVNETDGTVNWVQDGSPGSYFVIIGGHSSPVATSTGIYLGSSCGWNYDFLPADGNTIWQTSGACTTGGGVTSALYNGRFYARDVSTFGNPGAVNRVLDATTGTPAGSFQTSQALAFAGSTGFFVVSGKLEARDVSSGNPNGANPLWTFAGDGSLVTAPVVANGYVYIGSSQGHLYAVRADTGAQAWTDVTPSPMQGDSSWVEPGLAIGQGMLAVPAGNTLTVYGNNTSPGPPGPRPIPPQSFPPPPPPGSSGTQSSFQVDAAHTGFQSGDTTTPPLAYAWARNFASTPSTPLIAGGRAFVTANDPGGGNAMSLYALNLQTGADDWGPVALGTSNGGAGLAYDNGKVFAIIGANMTGLLRAYDAATGQQLWETPLTQTMQYGFGMPPVALNGSVYVTGNGHDGTMFAVSQVDGRLLWTTYVEDAALPAVTSTGIYVDNACWTMDINPQTGTRTWENRSICTGAGGGVPAVFGNQVYIPEPNIGNSVVNPQNGSVLDTFSADRTPAFYGSLGFFPIGSGIMAEDLATNIVDWKFDGDGSLVAGPVVVNGYVYVGSSLGNLYALKASDGTVAWSDNVKSPIAASMLNGLGAGGNTLLVPATNRLAAYVQCAAATCASAPLPPPVVTGIDPRSGFAAGGTTVYLRGSGFTGATGVSFGGTPASSFTVVRSDAMSAVSPPGSGTVDITVTTATGTSRISDVDQFAYIPPTTVTAVIPNQGPMAGGTRVTISGTNLGGAFAVRFGTNPASNIVVISNTQILATSPPGGGTVDITVTSGNGTSFTTASDQFTYLGPAAVPIAPPSSINPLRDSHPPPIPQVTPNPKPPAQQRTEVATPLTNPPPQGGREAVPETGEGKDSPGEIFDAFVRALLRFW